MPGSSVRSDRWTIPARMHRASECGQTPFETDGTPQLQVGPVRAHQSVRCMVIGSDQQVADFMGDHASQNVAVDDCLRRGLMIGAGAR